MVVLIHQKLCGITSHLPNVDNTPISVSVDILETVNRVLYSCAYMKSTLAHLNKKLLLCFFLYFSGR